MANKYDLKTWVRQSLVGAASLALSNACIGSNTAATGKTRFLTYIRVTRRIPASTAKTLLTVGIGDATTSIPAASTVFAATNLKAELIFPANASAAFNNIQEISGSIEHPIVAVAGGTYMGIAVGPGSATGSSVGVFAVYYDE